MSDIVIDTQTAIWFFTEPKRLSKLAENTLDNAEANGAIYVSAVTLIEIMYLVETGLVTVDVLLLLRDAFDDATTAFRFVDITREVTDEAESILSAEVPDLADRIIAATALYLNLPLVTKSSALQKISLIKTIW